MHVGFTGTRQGMSVAQMNKLVKFLSNLEGDEQHFFHHGDCKGADAGAHLLATQEGYMTVVHPPEDDYYRAFCKGDDIRNTKPYIQRNHDIVNECDILIVAPHTNNEETRSGTWATYRFAKKMGKPTLIMWR